MLVTVSQTFWSKHSLSHPRFGEAAVKPRGLLELCRAENGPTGLHRGKGFHDYRDKS